MRQFLNRCGRVLGATPLLILVLGLSLVGCGHESAPPSTQSTPPPTTVTTAPPAVALPTAVRIPAIGAESSLVPIGLKPDGSLDVPPVDQPSQAAWYQHSPRPGATGPALVVGHVDGKNELGIFHRLRELQPGAEIIIDRADSNPVTFTVTRTAQVNKDQLPPDLFANTPGPELRLVTCGGSFDTAAHSYEDNIIVYATQVL